MRSYTLTRTITLQLFLSYFHLSLPPLSFNFFFFNDTATTEIYTLSLHDALPIYTLRDVAAPLACSISNSALARGSSLADRKSTRLNSSHQIISYAVFCLKKKKK